MKKYLVTGGAGFVGSNLVEAILKKGDFVRVLDNLSTGNKKNIEEFFDKENFEFIQGDITNLDTCRTAVNGMDFVLHQAAIPSVQRSIEDPIKSNNANILGTLNMLVASKDEKIKRFIYAASSSAYGENPEKLKKEEFAPQPISPYALTKYAGERYCQLFWRIYGLPTVCLRYFNVFGPKQDQFSHYSAVIPNFINSIIGNKNPVIYGTGEQSRDFTYIDNVVEGNILAANSLDGSGEVVNIACGGNWSLISLIKILNEIMGKNIEPTFQQSRKGDVMHSMADISKAEKILGYKPIVGFKDGLAKTVEWYKNGKI